MLITYMWLSFLILCYTHYYTQPSAVRCFHDCFPRHQLVLHQAFSGGHTPSSHVAMATG